MGGDVGAMKWWREPALDRRHTSEWWRNAVIYQVGIWSFQDSDGDGRGDLGGVIQRLDYISSLGVDAIWLTPIHESPMDDYGYDITDLQSVGSAFGTMEQFDRLVRLVHQRGLKIVLDMVWNHTSDQHPWFQDSCSSREGRYADWYVWADPGADGGPPNNWRSAFNGESGWKYVDARKQYYFFNFLDSQPDLNWHNPEVREMALNCARFWFERGVDGMRLDAVNFYCHDPQLRDNPLREHDARMPDGIDPDNPAAQHCFVNSFCRRETLDYLRPLRRLCDQYPGTMLLGEVTLCEDTLEHAAQYVKGWERLHLAYHSALHFSEPMSARHMGRLLEKAQKHFAEGGICWIVGNHDYGRLRSYWGGKAHDLPEAFYRMVAALLVALPGALCLWQGDELGLPEARIPEDIPRDELKDPFGRLLYPRVKGRDGSRTPMPWAQDAHMAGFTTAEDTWLPIPPSHPERAVDVQRSDPDSLLNHWRQLLHWRRTQPALRAGKLRQLDVGEQLLAIIRGDREQELLCLFNISEEAVEASLSDLPPLQPTPGLTSRDFRFDAQRRRVRLEPWGVMFAELGTLEAAGSQVDNGEA